MGITDVFHNTWRVTALITVVMDLMNLAVEQVCYRFLVLICICSVMLFFVVCDHCCIVKLL